MDPEKRKVFLRNNRFYLIAYGTALAGVWFVFHFISDKDFSFLLTLGSLVRLFGFVLLLAHALNDGSVSGISLKTIQLYVIVFACRLLSVMLYEGYLPYDSSGDWLYQVVEVSGLISAILICVLVKTKLSSTYDEEGDKFGNNWLLPNMFGAVYLLVPCFLVACIVHPKLNQNFLTDTSWTTAVYLESLAIVPQLYMFQKSKVKMVDEWTSHFVFSIGLSRFFLFMFWLSSYHELSDHKAGWSGSIIGPVILCCNLLHLIIVGDYCYYYLKSAKERTPLVLSSSMV